MNEINLFKIQIQIFSCSAATYLKIVSKNINLTLYISRPVIIIINFYFPLSLLLIDLFWTPKCKHAVFQLLSIEDTY